MEQSYVTIIMYVIDRGRPPDQEKEMTPFVVMINMEAYREPSLGVERIKEGGLKAGGRKARSWYIN